MITVERASFTSKPASSTATADGNEDQDHPDPEQQDEADTAVQPHTATSLPLKEVQEVLYRILPAESEGGNYPLTLIRNAFHSAPPADTNTDLSAYFDDLEVSCNPITVHCPLPLPLPLTLSRTLTAIAICRRTC